MKFTVLNKSSAEATSSGIVNPTPSALHEMSRRPLKTKDQHEYKIQIKGVKKQASTIKPHKRLISDKEAVQYFITNLNRNTNIMGCVKRFNTAFQSLVVQFTSKFGARCLIHEAMQSKLFQSKRLFISPELSDADAQIERALRNKIYQLIQPVAPKAALKLKKLRWYRNDVEVKPSSHHIQPTRIMHINAMSIDSLERRMVLFNITLSRQVDLI